jgi:coniferyl-aldehyde dehydrogenase
MDGNRGVVIVDHSTSLARRTVAIPSPWAGGYIVPWNFPIYLSILQQLIYIFAASRPWSDVRKLAPPGPFFDRHRHFPRIKLAFFDETGGVGVEFSKRKFDHLLFAAPGQTRRSLYLQETSLPHVAWSWVAVMPSCAGLSLQNRRATALFVINAGQVCTSVDYLLTFPRVKTDSFVATAKSHCWQALPTIASPATAIVTGRVSFQRLTTALQEAEQAAPPSALRPGRAGTRPASRSPHRT